MFRIMDDSGGGLNLNRFLICFIIKLYGEQNQIKDKQIHVLNIYMYLRRNT